MKNPLFLLLALLAATVAPAQLDRGSFTGTILDSSGALVPGVRVTVRNANTGATYQTTTTASGQYTMPNLPIGSYDLTFQSSGFNTSVRRGVELSVAEVRRVDVTLEVGAVTESVEITAELPRLQTDAPDVSTNLGNRNMIDLPMAIGGGGRTMEDLAYKLVPGVSGSSWQSIIVGSQYFTKESLLDGASVTTTKSGHFGESAVSMEAVEEFKVQTSAVSAEFGRSQGAVFNYVMKSGTNEIHGSAYGLLRNEALNANTFANNFYGKKRAMDRKWDYALAFGGPIYIPKAYNGKNKTFFYVTYERYNENNLNYGAPNASHPIPDFYEGNFSRLLGGQTTFTDALGNPVYRGAIYDPTTFSQLPSGRWIGEMFPGNIIPKARFSQVAQNLNAIATKYYLPTVTGPDGKIPLENNAILPASTIYKRLQKQFSVKADHNISTYHKLSGSLALNKRPRWQATYDARAMWNSEVEYGGPLSQAIYQELLSPFARIAYDWTVSPTMLNHAMVYFNRFHNWFNNVNQEIDGAKALGIKNLSTPGYPSFLWGRGPFIQLAEPGRASQYNEAVDTWGFLDTFNFSYGRHFMKAGFDGNQIRYNMLGSYNPTLTFDAVSTSIPRETFAGSQTGYGFASYLLGIVHSASNAVPVPVSDITRAYAGFFQDDYKISQRLSLSLGVRWDYMSMIDEVYHRISGWTPQVTDPVSGLPGAYVFDGDCPVCTGHQYLGKNSGRNFAPRIGFAYRPFERTTLRGAYAIFYQGYGQYNQTAGNSIRTAWVGSWLLNADPVNPWQGIFNLDNGFPTDRYVEPQYNRSWGNMSGPVMFDPEYLKIPYIQRWNMNIQHEIVRNLVLDVGYLGVKGTSLRGDTLKRLNQMDPSYLQSFGRNLLNPVRNPAEAAANGIAYPFPGFTGTVASALRQYPQIVGNSTISTIGAPLGFSNTHSLQVTLDKRFSDGLAAYANYVWSKTLANAESGINGVQSALDYYNLKIEKSVATYDIPHMFKGYVAYELPFGRGKRWLATSGSVSNALLGGWSISAIVNYFSGTPLGLSGASSPLSGAWNGGSRINAAPGEMRIGGFDKNAFNLANTSSAGNTYLNKSVFSDIAPLTLGTAAYRYAQARGFGTINEDFGLQKAHRINEKYRLQIRAEFLNVFNRHTLGGIVTDVKSPLFGQVTSVSGNRSVQLGARLDF
ncbi:MAG: TonB-dependent receptor [Bryobacteraceae bacterium]|nr:TonB-dependent receptor [Bryobacteraceae bacterium]